MSMNNLLTDEEIPDINSILDKNLRSLDDISKKMLNDYNHRNSILESTLKFNLTTNQRGGKKRKNFQ
jgi:hypothetical protein